MHFARYFKQGQKILLRAQHPGTFSGHFETLTGFLHDFGPGYFDLSLPCQGGRGEEYPFAPDMPFEIFSDAMGLGIRLSGAFHGHRGGSLIRVKVQNDLQLFQRRISPRLDLRAGLRYTRGRGTLRSFRNQWEKNIRILESAPDLSKLPPFPTCQVNLSPGGIRFSLSPSPEIADLCLLLLNLGETGAPVCTLAEVVWVREQEGSDKHTAGMRFLSILESDQQKIARLIHAAGRQNEREELSSIP